MVYDIQMTITLKIGDIEVTASTPAEAAAVIRELHSSDKGYLNEGKGSSGVTEIEHIDPEILDRSLKFLEKIKEFSPKGADSDKIMMALRVAHPKAVGAKSVAVNKLLTDLGFRKGSVYRSQKKPHQGRLWKAGPSIEKAITTLKRELQSINESGALR